MRRFSFVHVGVTAALAVVGVTAVGVIQSVGAAGSGAPSSYVPTPPCRLIDTRSGPDNVGTRATPIGPGEEVTFAVWGANGLCTIPSTATAISTNVTSVNPTASSFLTVFPADASPWPTASNLNWTATSSPTPNAVTVSLSASGAIKVFNLAGSIDIIVDVVGYFQPAGALGSAGPPGPAGGVGPTGATGATGASGPQFGRLIGAASTVDATASVGTDTSITVGVDGNPIIAYSDITNSDMKVAKCNDAACTGANETLSTVDSVGYGWYTSIAVGADGNPAISYFDVGLSNLKFAKCNDPACTGSNETITTLDSTGNTGVYTSLAIGRDGNPVISFSDATQGDLKVVKCNDPACVGANETLTIVDSVGNVGGGTSLTIGTDGNPVVAYTDTTTGSLKVARCNDAACAGANETLSFADTGNVGQLPSIAIGVGGTPVISYYDANLTALKVVRCNDPACAGADETRSVVDNSGLVGYGSGIAIRPNGNPVIAYFESSLLDLKVAMCNDLACAGGDEEIAVLDSATQVGQYQGVTLGADAQPVISYFDNTAVTLKVAKVVRSSWTIDGWGR